MTASVRMELNVIHVQACVPALQGGRGRSVTSHVTKVTMVTSVNASVLARMAQLVILLVENVHVHQAIRDKGNWVTQSGEQPPVYGCQNPTSEAGMNPQCSSVNNMICLLVRLLLVYL